MNLEAKARWLLWRRMVARYMGQRAEQAHVNAILRSGKRRPTKPDASAAEMDEIYRWYSETDHLDPVPMLTGPMLHKFMPELIKIQERIERGGF